MFPVKHKKINNRIKMRSQSDDRNSLSGMNQEGKRKKTQKSGQPIWKPKQSKEKDEKGRSRKRPPISFIFYETLSEGYFSKACAALVCMTSWLSQDLASLLQTFHLILHALVHWIFRPVCNEEFHPLSSASPWNSAPKDPSILFGPILSTNIWNGGVFCPNLIKTNTPCTFRN